MRPAAEVDELALLVERHAGRLDSFEDFDLERLIALKQSTGSGNMDSFALNAIKLAQPFPPVPDVISKTGFPILARFRYILVDQTLTNILR